MPIPFTIRTTVIAVAIASGLDRMVDLGGGGGGGGLEPATSPASTAFEGASIIVMLRPSWSGVCSTSATSASSSASFSSNAVPRSGCVTSRPRNMIVTLTRSLPSRKRLTWPFLVS